MRALSLHQPWASSIGPDDKANETRSWYTPYIGPLAIHASKAISDDERLLCLEEPFISAICKAPGRSEGTMLNLPHGCIVAIVNQVGCIRTNRIHVRRSGSEPQRAMSMNGGPSKLDPLGKICNGRRFFGPNGELWIDQTEELFGNYSPDRWAHIYADIVHLPEPVPYRASQGFFECDDARVLEFARAHGFDVSPTSQSASPHLELAL